MSFNDFLDFARAMGTPGAYLDADPQINVATTRAAEGPGIRVGFIAAGVLHSWVAGDIPEPLLADALPTPDQQAMIDRLVGELRDDSRYRSLPNKTRRESIARVEVQELDAAGRGQHPELPPNFVYRVLRDAHDQV